MKFHLEDGDDYLTVRVYDEGQDEDIVSKCGVVEGKRWQDPAAIQTKSEAILMARSVAVDKLIRGITNYSYAL